MELLIFWVVMAFVVALVAGAKGGSPAGWFIYGLVIWPVALIHALVMPHTAESERSRAAAAGRQPCPHCAEMILPEARVCPFCRLEVEGGSAPPERLVG